MAPYVQYWQQKSPNWLKRLLSPGGPPHYYGDVVRKLFMLAGIIMLVSLPFFYPVLPVSVLQSLLITLVVGVLAGLTSPTQQWVLWLDVLACLPGMVIFEYHAITHYLEIPIGLFIVDQALTLIFFFALYFSVKTLRGSWKSDKA